MEDDQPVPRRHRRGGIDETPPPTMDRNARWLAAGAVLLGVIALGLTTWRMVASPAADCQSIAWGASPKAGNLPAGWTIKATQYQPDQLSMTLTGPQPTDQTTAQAVVYATVTCYPTDAAGAVTRSQAAARAAGLTVTARTDLGDQGYTAADASSGSTFIQFRHANVVGYVAGSGSASADDVDGVAGAFDRALGGDGSAAAVSSPAASNAATPSATGDLATAGSSAGPSPAASAAAPELEAALPTSVGGTPLTINSAVGTDVLGTDPGSRAIVAALRAAGSTSDAFQAAQAYDATGAVDLSITAFRVIGMSPDVLQKIVLETWLSAGGAGVTTSSANLGGRTVSKVDYGDGGVTPYVLTDGGIVYVIQTSVADLATQAVAALPSSGG